MFEAIFWQGGYYSIIDDDFVDSTPDSIGHYNYIVARVDAIIAVYEKRKLNVASNLVMFLISNDGRLEPPDQIVNMLLKYSSGYKKYHEQVQKLLLLQ